MKGISFACSIALLVASTSVRASLQPGGILLLEKCPGDAVTEAAIGNEALLEALLTPLLTGVISSGLKIVGDKLKEQAAEAQVDVLHTGAHFYTWRQSKADVKPEYWDISSWCIVITSKQSRATNRTVSQLVKGYKAYKISVTGDANRSLSDPSDAEAALVGKLLDLGFEDSTTPGLIAVMDVQLSSQKSEFRLLPRFVVMDHSIRESKIDTRQRDITFELLYTVPSAADALAKGLLKMEGLLIHSPVYQDPANPVITSHWMPLPALNDSEKARMTSAAALESQQKTHGQGAELSAAAAIALGANNWIDPSTESKWEPIEENGSCPALGSIRPDWLKAHALLENEKAKKNPSTKDVSLWTNVVTYFESCSKSQTIKKEITETGISINAQARSFDLTVAIKEFRERPVSKFFGQILADDNTRAALTTGVLGAIDPATRDANAKAGADARLVLIKNYEDSVFKAEVSTLAYEAAKVEEKATKFLQMKYDQRAANRAAEGLDIASPYPDAGTWLGK